MPNPVYVKIPWLVTHLSAIETLIYHREIEFDRVYFLRFCTNFDLRFKIELFDKCKKKKNPQSTRCSLALSHTTQTFDESQGRRLRKVLCGKKYR